jgi:hypothetical protein
MRSLVTHVSAGWQEQAAVENIGLGGACILIEREPVAVGDALTLSFTAPTLWDPLVIRARVAWLGTSAAGPRPGGVAFEHNATDAVFALYELIVTIGYE